MMKSLFLNLIFIPGILLAQDSPEIQINNMLDSWHSAAAMADMTSYFDKIDKDGIYIGTDATEYWTKQEFYNWSKPYFDKGKAWTFKAKERHIYFTEDQALAWFYEKLEASYGELRGSGVIRFEEGEWKIMQYVLSLPVPNEHFNTILELLAPE